MSYCSVAFTACYKPRTIARVLSRWKTCICQHIQSKTAYIFFHFYLKCSILYWRGSAPLARDTEGPKISINPLLWITMPWNFLGTLIIIQMVTMAAILFCFPQPNMDIVSFGDGNIPLWPYSHKVPPAGLCSLNAPDPSALTFSHPSLPSHFVLVSSRFTECPIPSDPGPTVFSAPHHILQWLFGPQLWRQSSVLPNILRVSCVSGSVGSVFFPLSKSVWPL